MKKKSICLKCNKEFEYDTTQSAGKYCSLKCRYADHSNIIKNSYTKELREKHRQSAIKQMQDSKQKEIRREKMKGREMTKEAREKISKKAKKYVDYRKIAFDAHGMKCQRCGKELTSKEAAVHHINGEHYVDDITDNSPDNLMVLCKNCHLKIHNQMDTLAKNFTGLKQFEQAANLILKGLNNMGMKLDKENFGGTPKRFARAYFEIFQGIYKQDEQIAQVLSTAFPSEGHNDMVIAKNITCYSMCPHHLLPVEYTVNIGYIPSPDGKVLGISKLARLATILAKKPALQESYTEQICNALQAINPKGVVVNVQGRHMCMRMRGIQARESSIITSAVRGAFEDFNTRQEFLAMVRK